MSALPPPLDLLRVDERGDLLPLPPVIGGSYGPLTLPEHPDGPLVYANFVETLDGVVSLAVPGKEGGREISGGEPHDRMVMGLLRAVADAVVVGAGTLRASPEHRWTPYYVYPPLADAYRALRGALGKPEAPLSVIVTASGVVDLDLPVFRSGAAPVLIVTTPAGLTRLGATGLPRGISAVAAGSGASLSTRQIIEAAIAAGARDTILLEVGPHLMAQFLEQGQVDELFLTLAPQIAGRAQPLERPGFAMGRVFAPEHPLWTRLVDVRRGGSHLFLRYTLR